MNTQTPTISQLDRIDTSDDFGMCAWARHFNVSESRVKEAVAAVGDRALRVREHLHGGGATSGSANGSSGTSAGSERPSARQRG